MRTRPTHPGRRTLVLATVITVVSLFAVPAKASFQAERLTVPPPDHIVIELVTVNGSGCPSGTADVAPAPDNTAFTVTYSTYLAKAGGSTDPTEARKNCQLNVNVLVPQGFTFAIAKADYRGYAKLSAGGRLLQRARYYFQGNSQTAFVDHWTNGAIDEDWSASDETPVAALVFKPCGEQRLLNINTQLRAYAGTDPSIVNWGTMDSTDGSIKTLYHFSWKHCP
jgi:uncharacterized protein DUF4360